MAYIKFDKRDIEQYESSSVIWECVVSLGSQTESNPILVPQGIKSITAIVTTTATSCKVQVSNNGINDVLAGGTLIWVDWDYGSVAVNSADSLNLCSAIRLSQTGAGATTLYLRAS